MANSGEQSQLGYWLAVAAAVEEVAELVVAHANEVGLVNVQVCTQGSRMQGASWVPAGFIRPPASSLDEAERRLEVLQRVVEQRKAAAAAAAQSEQQQ